MNITTNSVQHFYMLKIPGLMTTQNLELPSHNFVGVEIHTGRNYLWKLHNGRGPKI